MSDGLAYCMEETFSDVERLLHHVTKGFRKNPLLDPDDVTSAVHLGFVQAYHRWQKGGVTCRFTTLAGNKARNRVLDLMRRQMSRPRTVDISLLGDSVPERSQTPPFDLDDKSMSEDARAVVRLVLSRPLSIEVNLAELGPESPANWRQALRDFLSDLGWSVGKIKDVFEEIKGAL